MSAKRLFRPAREFKKKMLRGTLGTEAGDEEFKGNAVGAVGFGENEVFDEDERCS